jgi:hypothetical protein
VATIEVRRARAWYGAARRLRVFIDHVEVGSATLRAPVRFEVAPGRHSVYVSMDWTVAPLVEVDVADDQNATLVVVLPPSHSVG